MKKANTYLLRFLKGPILKIEY